MKRLLLLLLLCLASPAWALEKVVLQLKWKHQFQFAGYYAALEKGFYRAAGLDVELREASPGTDVIDEVLRGEADFGVGSTNLVLARGQGKPVVALAVILQRSPLALAAPQGRLQNIRDLAGRRVMVEPGGAELFAFFQREGLKSGDFRPLQHDFDTADLIAGRVDAISVYSTDETFVLRQAGFPYVLFSPRSAGVDFYGDNLFTREQLIKDKPAVVAAFREASLQGWRYAMQRPEEMADLILSRYSRRHSRAHLLFEAAEMQRLMQPDLIEVGHMSTARWNYIAEIFTSLEMLPPQSSIDGLIYDPRPPRLPAWVIPGSVAGLAVLLFAGGVVWRFARLNRALAAEIRARHEAEQLAATSTANFRHLMDIGPVPIVVTTLNGNRVLYANQHALRLFGLPVGNGTPAGRTVSEYYQYPGQREQILNKLRSDGMVREMVVGFVKGEGEAFDALISAIAIDFEGTEAIYSVLMDVTERNRGEAALRLSEARARDSNLRLRQQLDEIAKLQAALKEQAIRDGLTGFYNRRYLDETLEREIARLRREGGSMSVVMLDIDHFKALNDNYGHQVGDEALRAVAETLHRDIRSEDIPCRYGGEEFLILMPRMPLPVACERAEVWRQALAALRIVSGLDEIRLTVSMGIAVFPAHGDTPDKLTQSADLALYTAKKQGRNRVVVYSPRKLLEVADEP